MEMLCTSTQTKIQHNVYYILDDIKITDQSGDARLLSNVINNNRAH